jgi:hypothetical protein
MPCFSRLDQTLINNHGKGRERMALSMVQSHYFANSFEARKGALIWALIWRSGIMKERKVRLSTIGLIAGTRVALGAGLGLLLANRLTREQQQAAGWALFIVGALTTIPLVAEVFGGDSTARSEALHVEETPISPYVAMAE